MTMQPYFIDTTLRDGEQAPGVVFSLQDKIRIAALLDQAGVPELELGIPAMGTQEQDNMRTINNMGFSFKTLAWCRASKEDIRQAERSGCNGVHISFPVSSVLMKAMGKSREWLFSQLEQLIAVAAANFDYVTVGAQDASRAASSLLTEFVCAASYYGASRIRLADTVGLLNPFSTTELIKTIRNVEPQLPLEFHGHNDLGMATANTVAAFMAGANCLSTTVNGLGERAGNASMDEVALALELSLSQPCLLDTTKFTALGQLVADASGRTLSVDKPIIGSSVLTHESGIHTNCLLKDRSTYQLIPASLIGLKEQAFVIGKHSGKSSLMNLLDEAGFPYTEELCDSLILKIKELAAQQKKALTQEQVFELYTRLFTQTNTTLCTSKLCQMKK